MGKPGTHTPNAKCSKNVGDTVRVESGSFHEARKSHTSCRWYLSYTLSDREESKKKRSRKRVRIREGMTNGARTRRGEK